MATETPDYFYTRSNPPTASDVGAFPDDGITYGTAPLTDGVSELPTGYVYLQYEE